MPTYQYACTECGDELEVVQRFTDDPLKVCSACGGRLRKVFSPVGIVFKGSGFYRNDSRSDKRVGAGASANGKSGESSDSSGKSESGAKAESDAKSGSNGSGSSGSSGSESGSGSKDGKSGSARAGSKSSGTSSKVA